MRIVARRNPAREAIRARKELAQSDWRILRAVEAMLAREGALDADILARREAARDVLRKVPD